MIRPKALLSCVTAALLFLSACSSAQAPQFPTENDTINASEQQIGERLFVETRFAEYFAAHRAGVNDPLVAGDPVASSDLLVAYLDRLLAGSGKAAVDTAVDANTPALIAAALFESMRPTNESASGQNAAPVENSAWKQTARREGLRT